MLHTPFTFPNGLRAKNRLVLAPMTNCQSNPDGTLGEAEFAWLERNARGGFGIVLTCASYISPAGKAWAGQLGIHDDACIPGLQKLTQALSSQGALPLMQIFHGGERCSKHITGVQPISASSYKKPEDPNFEQPREMTIEDIQTVQNDFVQAAKRAYRAGFSGVELHGANGYLITQFISTRSNLRTDDYGGTLAKRARFVREVARACRQAVPKNFIVGIRLLPEGTGLDLDENIQIAQWLVEDGMDYIHLSLSSALAPSKKYPDVKKCIPSYFREAVGANFPLIAGGGIQLPSQAEALLQAGASMVYLGSIAIGNARWPINSQDSSYTPVAPPYCENYLLSQGISPQFMTYIRMIPRQPPLIK